MAIINGGIFDGQILLGGYQHAGYVVVKFTGEIEKIEASLAFVKSIVGQYHVNCKRFLPNGLYGLFEGGTLNDLTAPVIQQCAHSVQ